MGFAYTFTNANCANVEIVICTLLVTIDRTDLPRLTQILLITNLGRGSYIFQPVVEIVVQKITCKKETNVKPFLNETKSNSS